MLSSPGQDFLIDSLKLVLNKTKLDTSRVDVMLKIQDLYAFYQRDSAPEYFRQIIRLAQNIHFSFGQFLAYNTLSIFYISSTDYGNALEAQLTALKIAEKLPKGDFRLW